MSGPEAVWRVPADHPTLAGHFPGRPIVPGVVLLDRALQMAQAQRAAVTWQVTQVKFLSPCGPGDELHFSLQDGARGGLGFAVRCGGREIAVGHLSPQP